MACTRTLPVPAFSKVRRWVFVCMQTSATPSLLLCSMVTSRTCYRCHYMPPESKASKVHNDHIRMFTHCCSFWYTNNGLLRDCWIKNCKELCQTKITFSAIIERRENNTTTKMALLTNISVLAYQQFSSFIRSQYYVLINTITVIQNTTNDTPRLPDRRSSVCLRSQITADYDSLTGSSTDPYHLPRKSYKFGCVWNLQINKYLCVTLDAKALKLKRYYHILSYCKLTGRNRTKLPFKHQLKSQWMKNMYYNWNHIQSPFFNIAPNNSFTLILTFFYHIFDERCPDSDSRCFLGYFK
jgi:hypothetical protein